MKIPNLNAVLLVLLLLYFDHSQAQQIEKKSKFFLTAGYGLAGSFFVRSYQETLPFPSAPYRAFFKKNFIGNALNSALGMRLGKRYELKAGINYQHFTRHVKATDTIVGVVISLNTTIHHRDYMYFVSVHRLYEKRKHLIFTGLGIYYLNPRQETIEYGYGIPNFVSISEPRGKYLEEGGVLADVAYEYKFQPKVNLGIRTQFYYTASADILESFTLFPFIKINF
jgi:hypothetical protein